MLRTKKGEMMMVATDGQGQGLPLVQSSDQPKPVFVTKTLKPPSSIPQKMLTLS